MERGQSLRWVPNLIGANKLVGTTTGKEAIASESPNEVVRLDSSVRKEGVDDVINQVLSDLEREVIEIPGVVFPN